jgi:hypothetical protein
VVPVLCADGAQVMSLVIALVVGSGLGWFVTHPPEWFLRAGARFFGEVER